MTTKPTEIGLIWCALTKETSNAKEEINGSIASGIWRMNSSAETTVFMVSAWIQRFARIVVSPPTHTW